MTHDPIFQVFSIWGRRAMIFVLTAASLSLSSWGWCLIEMNVDLANWSSVLASSFDLASHPVQTLLLRGSIAIGFMLTTIIYLAVALWWRGRVQVHYQRGGRFVDQRDGGNQ